MGTGFIISLNVYPNHSRNILPSCYLLVIPWNPRHYEPYTHKVRFQPAASLVSPTYVLIQLPKTKNTQSCLRKVFPNTHRPSREASKPVTRHAIILSLGLVSKYQGVKNSSIMFRRGCCRYSPTWYACSRKTMAVSMLWQRHYSLGQVLDQHRAWNTPYAHDCS